MDATDAETLGLLIDLEELVFVFFFSVIRRLFHDDECSAAAAVVTILFVIALWLARCPVEAHVAHEVAVAIFATSAVAPRNGFVIESCLCFFSGRDVPAERACLLGCVIRVESAVRVAVGFLFVIAFAVGYIIVDVLGHPELAANLHELVRLVVSIVGHRHAVDGRGLVYRFVDGDCVRG